ncbi:hypothetical protein, partial [Pseudomonas viridiflava]|uniref:hypothetical protein n=1 Tax=Pseudomonas viridiflava TaxID=33069 RepID=UPI00197F2273
TGNDITQPSATPRSEKRLDDVHTGTETGCVTEDSLPEAFSGNTETLPQKDRASIYTDFQQVIVFK